MVFEKVVKIIAKKLDYKNIDKITMETFLIEDLNIDSIDTVEVIIDIEEEFDIEILDEAVENFKCIGDIVKYVANY